MGRPRIEDVATQAGISAITVSRALRNPTKVAPATRARVAAAIEALGYIPNLSASSLASRRSGIVALLVPTIANSIFADTVQGVADAIGAAGLQLLLGDYRYSDVGELNLLRALIGRQPDAIVVVGVVRDEAIRAMLSRLAIPVIETWDMTDQPIDTVVGFSNHAAGAAIARHFIASGHTRLAFAGGGDHRARARAAGFSHAAIEAGLTLPQDIKVDGIGVAQGRRALAEMIAATPHAQAVFFATDILAVGGLLECQRRGIAVPGQIAIAGLGDLEIARELDPALTTVAIPSYEIGRRAGEIVTTRLAGKPLAKRVIDLGFTVRARASSVR